MSRDRSSNAVNVMGNVRANPAPRTLSVPRLLFHSARLPQFAFRSYSARSFPTDDPPAQPPFRISTSNGDVSVPYTVYSNCSVSNSRTPSNEALSDAKSRIDRTNLNVESSRRVFLKGRRTNRRQRSSHRDHRCSLDSHRSPRRAYYYFIARRAFERCLSSL